MIDDLIAKLEEMEALHWVDANARRLAADARLRIEEAKNYPRPLREDAYYDSVLCVSEDQRLQLQRRERADRERERDGKMRQAVEIAEQLLTAWGRLRPPQL